MKVIYMLLYVWEELYSKTLLKENVLKIKT